MIFHLRYSVRNSRIFCYIEPGPDAIVGPILQIIAPMSIFHMIFYFGLKIRIAFYNTETDDDRVYSNLREKIPTNVRENARFQR